MYAWIDRKLFDDARSYESLVSLFACKWSTLVCLKISDVKWSWPILRHTGIYLQGWTNFGNLPKYLRCEVCTVTKILITVFWVVTPCGLYVTTTPSLGLDTHGHNPEDHNRHSRRHKLEDHNWHSRRHKPEDHNRHSLRHKPEDHNRHPSQQSASELTPQPNMFGIQVRNVVRFESIYSIVTH
jgi:hypothetical protein